MGIKGFSIAVVLDSMNHQVLLSANTDRIRLKSQVQHINLLSYKFLLEVREINKDAKK